MSQNTTPPASRPPHAENFILVLSFQTDAFPVIHAGNQKAPLVQ